MAGRTVQLRVGGQTYRVVSSASEEDLLRLAAVVDARLAKVVPPGRLVTPQAMLLAAIALAHDLEQEQAKSAELATKARGAIGRMLERVDAALEAQAEIAPAAAPRPAPSTTSAGTLLRPLGPSRTPADDP